MIKVKPRTCESPWSYLSAFNVTYEAAKWEKRPAPECEPLFLDLDVVIPSLDLAKLLSIFVRFEEVPA